MYIRQRGKFLFLLSYVAASCVALVGRVTSHRRDRPTTTPGMMNLCLRVALVGYLATGANGARARRGSSRKL